MESVSLVNRCADEMQRALNPILDIEEWFEVLVHVNDPVYRVLRSVRAELRVALRHAFKEPSD